MTWILEWTARVSLAAGNIIGGRWELQLDFCKNLSHSGRAKLHHNLNSAIQLHVVVHV